MARPQRRQRLSPRILPYTPDREAELLALSLRAWAPVFRGMRPAVPPYVYDAFYPAGWRARQEADIAAFLQEEGHNAWLAESAGALAGWVGLRLHPADRMGAIHILAVDPAQQRRGVARALMDHAMAEMRRAGMAIAMVETGDDPGHAPSRATYEQAGFERWPVARYFRKL
jgi:GNAT superfamily N-acetyltransferase